MRRLLIAFGALCFSASVFGQQIQSAKIDSEDLRGLLGAAGYELYGFDLTQLLDQRYDIALIVREYVKGEKTGEKAFSMGPNKVLLTDFPEEAQAEVLALGMVKDAKTGTIHQAEKMTVGLYPSGNDSVKMISVNIPDMQQLGYRLGMRAVTTRNSDRKIYQYRTRPFSLGELRAGEFTPLVFYGSAWCDEGSDLIRFCGETQISPDLSEEIVGKVPHFYVIGVRITKQ